MELLPFSVLTSSEHSAWTSSAGTYLGRYVWEELAAKKLPRSPEGARIDEDGSVAKKRRVSVPRITDEELMARGVWRWQIKHFPQLYRDFMKGKDISDRFEGMAEMKLFNELYNL